MAKIESEYRAQPYNFRDKDNSSNSAFASFRSAVSDPSVIGACDIAIKT